MKICVSVLVLLFGFGVGNSAVENGPSCPVVVQKLLPCLNYIRGGSAAEAVPLSVDKPPQVCCTGVKGISDEIKSQQDKSEVCQCLKQVLSGIGSYDASKIPQLSTECGASQVLPPIDRNTDCSKV
uniref:Bifunctional inhibitor/plant lipid transfer protein/seed storage helical domain-containing protein n=1 Tax=Kalanchoe fedtschenkoi TaxID=63787 RepID=A0A7N0VKU9_KALFE